MKKLMLAALLLANGAYAGETPKAAERATTPAFEKLKTLAGDWAMTGGDGSVASSWHVTANGTAVVETLFPGQPHEMLTVYTLHGQELHLTHYCAAGNQPEMKADKTADAAKMSFQFAGGPGINPKKDMHMHAVTLTFPDGGVHEDWTTFDGGKAGDPKVIDLKRVAPPRTEVYPPKPPAK